MVRLRDTATAISRRVGDDATLSVRALSEEHYERLAEKLTVERLRDFLAELDTEQIRRFELPNLAAINFVLCDVFNRLPRHWLLDGSGKLLANRVLELELESGG